jgi:hypothetical protein
MYMVTNTPDADAKNTTEHTKSLEELLTGSPQENLASHEAGRT